MKRGGFIQRRTPLRARKPFHSKGDPGTATAASGAVPVSLEALRFAKPRRERPSLESRARVDRRQGKRASAQTGGAAVGDAVQSASLSSLAFPKPVKKVKASPKPIPRSWMRKSARGTKHSRREREFGRMAFYSSLWCMLRDLARGGSIPPANVSAAMACDGPIEVAHLGDRGATGTGGWRRAPDATTAPLCRHHHRGIDGKVGGKAPWYVALGREGQSELRGLLVLFSSNYWDGLTPAGRAEWDANAERQRKERRAA